LDVEPASNHLVDVGGQRFRTGTDVAHCCLATTTAIDESRRKCCAKRRCAASLSTPRLPSLASPRRRFWRPTHAARSPPAPHTVARDVRAHSGRRDRDTSRRFRTRPSAAQQTTRLADPTHLSTSRFALVWVTTMVRPTTRVCVSAFWFFPRGPTCRIFFLFFFWVCSHPSRFGKKFPRPSDRQQDLSTAALSSSWLFFLPLTTPTILQTALSAQ
jgi:hypothetical protein